MMKKNWKTTSAGIMAIIAGFTMLYFKRSGIDEGTISAAAASILTGMGLLFSKDFDVSGTDKQ